MEYAFLAYAIDALVTLVDRRQTRFSGAFYHTWDKTRSSQVDIWIVAPENRTIDVKEGNMVAPLDRSIAEAPLVDVDTRIPKELNPKSSVYELRTIGDAREALARLRELRRDFDASTKRTRDGGPAASEHHPVSLPGKGEEMLAGLSNIQRMRTIRREIAYLEDLMVRIAARDFELEETRHQSYLSGIGCWTERELDRRRAI